LAAESSRFYAARTAKNPGFKRSRFSDEGMVWRKTIDTSIRSGLLHRALSRQLGARPHASIRIMFILYHTS